MYNPKGSHFKEKLKEFNVIGLIDMKITYVFWNQGYIIDVFIKDLEYCGVLLIDRVESLKHKFIDYPRNEFGPEFNPLELVRDVSNSYHQ
mgnify:CR=1 FL=1